MTDATGATGATKPNLNVDVAEPNQNFEENLRRLNEKYEDEHEEIVDDVQRAMVDVLMDYCKMNPTATQPIEGIAYQEDSASIVFDMGNGESIYMTPVWTPFLYKAHSLSCQELLELTTEN